MDYIIYFDIAAIFTFAITIFLNFNQKNLPITRNTVYFIMLTNALVASVLDIIAALLKGNGGSTQRLIYWIIQCLTLTATHSMGILFSLYCITVVDAQKVFSQKQKFYAYLMIAVPYILDLAIIWLSPVVSKYMTLAFTLDKSNMYQRGGFFFYMLYVLVSTQIVISNVIILKFHKILKPEKIICIFSFLSVMIISIVIQIFVPRLLIEFFGISLAAMAFSSYIQSPEDYIDSNTDVFNQTAFITIANKLFSSHKRFITISIIIDDINFLANTFGTNEMNKCFKIIADFLNKKSRYAYVFYLGQGKYSLIIKPKYSNEIEHIVGDILLKFNRPWPIGNIEYKMYSTTCITECPIDAATADDILSITNLVSEDSRYKKNIIYARNIDTEIKKRSAYIEHILRYGIEQDRFTVYYQPIFSTKEDQIIGAEAILKLRDEFGKYISSEEFLPIAEKTGTILAIGDFTFKSVCKMLSEINTSAYGIKKIDINLSVAQCLQENFAAQLLLTREKYHVPAQLLNLEITELAAEHSPEVLLKNMKYLSDEGIELALDDYGAGYSNLDYLLSLPFKMVKIDKEIVDRAYIEKRTNDALRTIIDMIHGMGMSVMAEGVSSLNQVLWLTKCGCDYLQGNYYAKPLSKDDFLSLMAKIHQNPRFIRIP